MPSDGFKGVVRLALLDYWDDFTTVNSLGVKHGSHKYTAHLGACLNLPKMLRTTTDYILLHSIVTAKLQKANGGMAWAVAGVDGTGKTVVDDSYAKDLRDLERGIELDIPNDSSSNGEKTRILLQVSPLILSSLMSHLDPHAHAHEWFTPQPHRCDI